MSRLYSNEERRARLKIFMRRNKIRTTELARKTGYSLGYLSTSLGSAGLRRPESQRNFFPRCGPANKASVVHIMIKKYAIRKRNKTIGESYDAKA